MVTTEPGSESRPAVTRLDEALSEISDGEGFLYPEGDDSKVDMSRMRIYGCKMKPVKELFANTDKVRSSNVEIVGHVVRKSRIRAFLPIPILGTTFSLC